MLLCRRVWGCALLLTVTATIGCRSASRMSAVSVSREPATADSEEATIEAKPRRNAGVVTVSGESRTDDDDQEIADIDDAFLGQSELHLEALVAAVQARNPSLQATIAAWAAAAERYPQAVALDDPMLQSMLAPASFPSSSPVQSSYYVGAAQRIPWHGKRELRGQIAQWEATAASWNAEEMKLRLAAATRMAYFDYYLIRRETELNERNLEVLQDFRSTAKAKYEANQVSQQDLSAADLELAKLEQTRLDLKKSQRIIIARINTLLHRRPDHSLPSPVSLLSVGSELPEAETVRELAWQHRPELSAMAAKIQSEQHAVLLACKEYYPDFEFMARYDQFWTDSVQRGQIGMNMNVPINQGRRAAAVREAQFRVNKMRAEYEQQRDSIAEEVQIAIAGIEASRQAVELYEERILPFAQQNLESARAEYEAGSIDFLRVMDARKQFIEQQIGYHLKLTDYHRNRAELERAVGTTVSVLD